MYESKEFERCWLCTHTDEGPILTCAWYRPPDTSLPRELHEADINSFEEELKTLSKDVHGVLIMGDLNFHHRMWLRFSSQGNTALGRKMHEIAVTAGLQQMVREPTREGNLLDLVLTNCMGTRVMVGKKKSRS